MSAITPPTTTSPFSNKNLPDYALGRISGYLGDEGRKLPCICKDWSKTVSGLSSEMVPWKALCPSKFATEIIPDYVFSRLVDYLGDEARKLPLVCQMWDWTIFNLSSESVSWKEQSIVDWRQRPQVVQNAIAGAFFSLKQLSKSAWGAYNGREGYEICSINDYGFMESLIREAPLSQTHFYAMDIGAGNFQWGEGLAKHLNTLKDLREDITVHIISLRGESNHGEKQVKKKNCIIYNLGAFAIEKLEKNLKQNDLYLTGKLDLIVTRWCFRHLVDPLGTFAQAYRLLRPKTGHFFGDGFVTLMDKQNTDEPEWLDNFNMLDVLRATRGSFLMQSYDRGNRFVVRMEDASFYPPSFLYDGGILSNLEKYQIGSQCVTKFQSIKSGKKSPIVSMSDHDLLLGNRKLFQDLYIKGVVENSSRWFPLEKEGNPYYVSDLHRVVMRGDIHGVKESLSTSHIDEPTALTRSTALVLATKKQHYPLAKRLLELGANPKLSDKQGNGPLHHAVKADSAQAFIELLLEYGADLNQRNLNSHTPVRCAINLKKAKLVSFLLSKGAQVKDKEKEALL